MARIQSLVRDGEASTPLRRRDAEEQLVPRRNQTRRRSNRFLAGRGSSNDVFDVAAADADVAELIVRAHDDKAEIRKLGVTRDFGTWVEADAGARSGEQVILDPPVNLVDGAKVRLRSEAAAPAK